MYHRQGTEHMRETMKKQMDETIFDEDYINEKVNRIAQKYKGKNEEFDNDKL